jgi:hypothetical protein
MKKKLTICLQFRCRLIGLFGIIWEVLTNPPQVFTDHRYMNKFISGIATSFIIIFTAHAQDLKKLGVFVTDTFDPKASITVPDFNDPLLASTDLSSALAMNGFKVISDRMAADRLKLNTQMDLTETGSEQNVSLERKLDIKSVYAVKLTYQSRPDTGCGGRVISRLSGHI